MSELPTIKQAGETFGRYRIESLLGMGGMGAVHRAVDTQLGRTVALKVVRRDRIDGSGVDPAQRLLGEARAVAALRHPNVARVYDAGTLEGEVFVAMELIEGRTLRAHVGDPDTPLAQKKRWLIEIARALEAAHRAGIVHRDVKPDNVLVGNDGIVRVIDFGLAKRISFDTGVMTVKTQAPETAVGRVVGTISYMAPEQLAGGEVSASWDQFAWGLVAYELLTGKHPRRGALPEPLPLASELEPGVSFDEAAAIQLALAPNAARRFPSMSALLLAFGGAKDADRATGEEPTAAARLPEAPAPAAAPLPARRSWSWLVAALVVACAGVAMGWFFHRSRAPVAPALPASAVTFDAPPSTLPSAAPSVAPSTSATVAVPAPPSASAIASTSAPRASAPRPQHASDAKTCICSGSTGRLCPLDADWSLLRCSCLNEGGYVSTDPGRSGWDFAAKGSAEGQPCHGFASNGQPSDGKLTMCVPVCGSLAFAGLHRDHCRGRVPGTGSIAEGTLYCY